MNTTLEIVVYGGAVPAVVSIIVSLICRRGLPSTLAERYWAAAALATAFFAAYALLPWTQWLPKRHWQWLPYLGTVAMIAGPVTLAPGVHRAERWLVHLALGIATACLLVPAWSTLSPPRPVFMAILAAYLFVLMAALDALPMRLLGQLFLAHLAIVGLVVAVLLAASVSVKFGQLALIATAALAGCWASLFMRPLILPRGLIAAFAILVGGLAFVGCVEPERPQFEMLLAPAAPLALWVCASGPLARLNDKKTVLAQITTLLVPLAIATCLVLMS